VVVDFECAECGTIVKANSAGIEIAKEVTCLNPDCGCRYIATPSENGFLFVLDASIAVCSECSHEIKIPTSKLRLG
jgi:DNA-directed RNA polymerase subunit RPC12/RpoP